MCPGFYPQCLTRLDMIALTYKTASCTQITTSHITTLHITTSHITTSEITTSLSPSFSQKHLNVLTGSIFAEPAELQPTRVWPSAVVGHDKSLVPPADKKPRHDMIVSHKSHEFKVLFPSKTCSFTPTPALLLEIGDLAPEGRLPRGRLPRGASRHFKHEWIHPGFSTIIALPWHGPTRGTQLTHLSSQATSPPQLRQYINRSLTHRQEDWCQPESPGSICHKLDTVMVHFFT